MPQPELEDYVLPTMAMNFALLHELGAVKYFGDIQTNYPLVNVYIAMV